MLRIGRHLRCAALAAAALLTCGATAGAAPPAPAPPQDFTQMSLQELLDVQLKVKAAFLFNFAKFTTWPPAKAGAADAPLALCVLGESPIGPVLQETVRGRSIGGHAIDVLQSARAEELRRCHIVYLGATDAGAIAAGLDALAGHGVLTVHEAAEAQPRGTLRFFLSDGGRVRFEVNVGAAAREHLSLSSKLLDVAQVVNR